MESRASSSVEIRLLGPIEVRIDGRDVPLGGPRQRALLGLLALRAGQVISSDELVEDVWAGDPPDGADTTLRSYVSRLRHSLEATVSIDRTDRGYVLAAPAGSVDAIVFDGLIRDGTDALQRGAPRRAREALGSALGLWRGRPFGEVGNEGSLAAAADRLDEQRANAMERRIEADLALGRSGDLVEELEALVREQPFRERLWQHLMLALYRSGRQADALAAYHRARAALDEHLGIEPGEELRALEAAILQQSVLPAAVTASRHPLPIPLSSFVGRVAELADLEVRLAANRLVTLTGVGGVGKTRLALELARRSAPALEDGAVFIDLAPLGDASLVAKAVAQALEVREHGDTDVADLLAAHVRSLEVLLLLDNCEHVADTAAALVDRLLRSAPGVRVLATSRAPLGVPGEVEFGVAPLSVETDAVELLLARARSARASIAADDVTMATAARICADLEGLPLAIELAAARARSLSLEEIARRLDDRFRFLVSWRRLSTARHRTLAEAMDWSYELLSPEEQRLLAGLSVFAGGFGLEAVVAVAADSADDEDETLTRLDALIAASLVLAVERGGVTRYRLLETVRQYAARRLEAEGRPAMLRDRHAAWYLDLAEAAAPELTGEGQGAWFARLESEQDNLRAAFAHLAATRDWASHLRLGIALTRFWYVRGHLAEGLGLLQQALAAERSVAADAAQDALLRRRALTAAASLALLKGEYATATSFAEAGLAVARQTGEDRLVANALSNLGAIVLAAGDASRAGPLLDQAVAAARAAGDQRILALAVNNRGDFALTQGDFTAARPLFEESLELLRSRGDTANVARALFNLGASELELGRHGVAGDHFREGLALARDAGDREDIAWILEGLAALAAAAGALERAALLLGAADAQLEAMGADHKPYERSLRERTEAALRSIPGDPPVAPTMARGAALEMSEAIDLGLATEA